MGKWIEWVPGSEPGIFAQLLKVAGKHSGVIWMVEPPPYIKLACTEVSLTGVEHYMAEGGVPIGWVDTDLKVHTFKLEPPFDPPNFCLVSEDGHKLAYADTKFTRDFLDEMYLALCQQHHLNQQGFADA